MEVKEFLSHDIPVSWVHVETEEDASVLVRPCGQYTTIETGRLDQLVQFESVCACLAEQLQPLLAPYFGKALCVCAIGNHALPHDALGSETVRRFSSHAYESFELKSEFTKIAAVCPGGKDIDKPVYRYDHRRYCVRHGCGLCACCRCQRLQNIERLCSAIDLTSSGMQTYSRTVDLTQTTIGVPVVSITVPTVL